MAWRLLWLLQLASAGKKGEADLEKGTLRTPVALQASLKDRLLPLIDASLTHAAEFLTRHSRKGLFKYQFPIAEESKWETECPENQEKKLCLMRNFIALDAGCSAKLAGFAFEPDAELAKASFAPYVKMDTDNGLLYMYEEFGQLQASKLFMTLILRAAATCAVATKDPAWLINFEQGIKTMAGTAGLAEHHNSFHERATIWGNFAVIRGHMGQFPKPIDPKIMKVLTDHLDQWDVDMLTRMDVAVVDGKLKTWSFAAGEAIYNRYKVLRKKSKMRSRMWKAAYTQGKLFMEHMYEKFKSPFEFQCGALQGLASSGMAAAANETTVKMALDMSENLIHAFQLGKVAIDPPEGAPEEYEALTTVLKTIKAENFEMLDGGFVRDVGQMYQERRKTIRIDDTAMCINALLHTRSMISSMQVWKGKGDL